MWAENRATLELFLALTTQWRVGAMGGYLGLDYPAVEAVMRALRVKERRETWLDLQAMERAALPILNEPRDT